MEIVLMKNCFKQENINWEKNSPLSRKKISILVTSSVLKSSEPFSFLILTPSYSYIFLLPLKKASYNSNIFYYYSQ